MNRLWWGLFGVAILASSTGCRSCGDSRFRLFKRESCDAPGQLMSSKGNDCNLAATSLQPGMTSFPTYGTAMPNVSYPPSSGSVETIPPTWVPATPMPAVPGGAAKNVLPPPQGLVPPTGVVGYAK